MDNIHAKIKEKYVYFSDSEIEVFILRAKAILIDQLYPADLSIDYLTFDVPARFEMWIFDCVKELIERDGLSTYTGYSENGVSFKFASDGSVSQALLNRVQRIAGVAK